MWAWTFVGVVAAFLIVFTIMVVNVIVGHIPYIGACLGGGPAVIVAPVVTALGGLVGGIVGLILAVPAD